MAVGEINAALARAHALKTKCRLIKLGGLFNVVRSYRNMFNPRHGDPPGNRLCKLLGQYRSRFSSMKSRLLAQLDEEIPSLIKRGADIYKDQVTVGEKIQMRRWRRFL